MCTVQVHVFSIEQPAVLLNSAVGVLTFHDKGWACLSRAASQASLVWLLVPSWGHLEFWCAFQAASDLRKALYPDELIKGNESGLFLILY